MASIIELPATTSASSGHELPINQGGAMLDKRITVANLFAWLTGNFATFTQGIGIGASGMKISRIGAGRLLLMPDALTVPAGNVGGVRLGFAFGLSLISVYVTGVLAASAVVQWDFNAATILSNGGNNFVAGTNVANKINLYASSNSAYISNMFGTDASAYIVHLSSQT